MKVMPTDCCSARDRAAVDKNILLDLKDVAHVDSATLASFVFLLNDIKEKGRQIGIIDPPVPFKNHLDLTKAGDQFRIFQDENAALGVLK